MAARRSIGRETRTWTVRSYAGEPLLLDLITGASPIAACSLYRKLARGYSGPAAALSRDSGGTLDLGFNGNLVDWSGLATFGSGTIVRLITIYDQSGQGYNFTQGTNGERPIVWSSGAQKVMSNGRPAALWVNSANSNLKSANLMGLSGNPAMTVGCSFARTTGENRLWCAGPGTSGSGMLIDAEVSRGCFLGIPGAGRGNRQLSYTTTAALPHSWIFKKAAGASVSGFDVEEGGVNLTQSAISNGSDTFNLTTNAFTIGNFPSGGDGLDGYINAWIGFAGLLTGSDLAALRTEHALHA